MSVNSWLPRLAEDLNETGMDPIQIFANISDPHSKTALRTRRLQSFGKLLDIEIPSEIDFAGCPTMFNIKVSARRPMDVQDQIWELLFQIIKEKQQALTPGLFGALKGWYGISITSLTVFFFWIDAQFFLPTDQHTIRYLKGMGLVKGRPKSYADYMEILNNNNIKDYPGIAERALISSLLKSEEKSETLPPEVTESQDLPPSTPIEIESTAVSSIWNGGEQIQGCRLLAIRPYKDTDEDWRRVLTKRGEIYSFYKAFSFRKSYLKYHENNDSEVLYDPFKDVPLYQDGKLQVHISAVVGENGSGKSTLIELILLAINNFTTVYSSIKNDLVRVEKLYVDIFFITDALYKLSIQGDGYFLKRYERSGNKFSIIKDDTLLEFDFDQFFYSIVTNYALYALNSNQIGDWVKKLFHKNDQYQVPINISPFRDKGIININRENDLVITRLVANLLLPVTKKKRNADTIRKLTANKSAEKLKLKLDRSKLSNLYEYPEKNFVKFDKAAGYWKTILSLIKKEFDIKPDLPDTPLINVDDYIGAAWMYLLKKIISICMTYRDFNIFFDAETNTFNAELLDNLVFELKKQKSHVTHKFYQVIHFMNDDHLQLIKNETDLDKEVEYDIDELANTIEKKVLNAKDNVIKTIHFAPPAFLKTSIWLTGNVNLNDLSSGEKQRIYSVSSVVYHLVNIDSNADQDDLVRYPCVNVVFEEVELYFHPEMQRNFISYFLNYVNRIEYDIISSINVIFVTHSPFILSDIPADNIIFLGDTEPGIKTFASNIHTMLAESFFLKDGFMGEYAKDKVNDLINYLIGEKYTGDWNVNNSATVINAIGEKLLKSRLLDIYRKKFETGKSREERIMALYNQIQAIENEED